MIGGIYQSRMLCRPLKIVQLMNFIIQLRLIVGCCNSPRNRIFSQILLALMCIFFKWKMLKHMIGNQYRSFRVWYGDFWRVLKFKIPELRYSKIAIFEGFGESLQLQNLRKKSKVCPTKTIFHDYQLGTRPDGLKKWSKICNTQFEC